LYAVEGHLASEESVGKFQIRLQIIRVGYIDKGHVNEFRLGVPQHLTERIVHLQEAMGAVLEGYSERPLFKNSAETFFTFVQSSFSKLKTLGSTKLECEALLTL
jgi:hypothetical protein